MPARKFGPDQLRRCDDGGATRQDAEAYYSRNFEDLANIRVVKRGGGHRLVAEAFPRLLVGGRVGGQDLDGDLTIKPWVEGTVYNTHAAFTNTGEDFIRAEASAGRYGHH
jgi:hypothetical protein